MRWIARTYQHPPAIWKWQNIDEQFTHIIQYALVLSLIPILYVEGRTRNCSQEFLYRHFFLKF